MLRALFVRTCPALAKAAPKVAKKAVPKIAKAAAAPAKAAPAKGKAKANGKAPATKKAVAKKTVTKKAVAKIPAPGRKQKAVAKLAKKAASAAAKVAKKPVAGPKKPAVRPKKQRAVTPTKPRKASAAATAAAVVPEAAAQPRALVVVDAPVVAAEPCEVFQAVVDDHVAETTSPEADAAVADVAAADAACPVEAAHDAFVDSALEVAVALEPMPPLVSEESVLARAAAAEAPPLVASPAGACATELAQPAAVPEAGLTNEATDAQTADEWLAGAGVY